MNENKHTKGPWFVDGGLESVFTEVEGEGGLTTICDLPEWLGEYQQEKEANAHLIAAAPEMLEALVEYKRYFNLCIEAQDPPDLMGLHTEVRRLTTIINKAKGINK